LYPWIKTKIPAVPGFSYVDLQFMLISFNKGNPVAFDKKSKNKTNGMLL
jgi:hypothetical protein